jgi:predicted RNase H-like nuclease
MLCAMTVVGIDACPGGWVGIVLDDAAHPTGVFGRTVARLLRAAPPVTLITIDIPIGLPDTGSRAADHAARIAVGPRWQSVFLTPIRAALEAPTYAEANHLARQQSGAGISRQAYGLRTKILEVDAWLTHAPTPVFEVHPEVCFATMASAPVATTKKSWAGLERRRQLLRLAGIELASDLGEAGRRANADDVLDAAAAAWTAQRLVAGTARPLPDPPELSPDGRAVAIWA